MHVTLSVYNELCDSNDVFFINQMKLELVFVQSLRPDFSNLGTVGKCCSTSPQKPLVTLFCSGVFVSKACLYSPQYRDQRKGTYCEKKKKNSEEI